MLISYTIIIDCDGVKDNCGPTKIVPVALPNVYGVVDVVLYLSPLLVIPVTTTVPPVLLNNCNVLEPDK